MHIKQILVLCFSLLSATLSFAGAEDWTGNYKIKFSANDTVEAAHSPTRVQFMFLSAGKCIQLSKGAVINGVELKQDVNLCTNSKVEVFTAEVAKLGAILNKTIKLGPTYPK